MSFGCETRKKQTDLYCVGRMLGFVLNVTAGESLQTIATGALNS
jgi:hypothetical protein